LDREPYLFNCQNGTLDLRDSKDIRLRPHQPSDFISRISPAIYDPAGTCPRFMAFLNDIVPDKEVQRFLQQWAGYSLTGDISEQKLVLFWSSGANGKSTYNDAVRFVYGDYAQTIQFASLLVNNGMSRR
jgi:putative DNA primase/helicase